VCLSHENPTFHLKNCEFFSMSFHHLKVFLQPPPGNQLDAEHLALLFKGIPNWALVG